MLLRLSPRQYAMQRRLFSLSPTRRDRVDDAGLARMLAELRAAPELAGLRLWLVGSRLDTGMAGSDIDVVVSPATGEQPGHAAIEAALWRCRELGLRRACSIDPIFREQGPTVALAPLPPDAILKSVKLASPKMTALMAAGLLREWRLVGEASVAFSRRAGDADFYGKLPIRDFGGASARYLRPAMEVATAGSSRVLADVRRRPGISPIQGPSI
jgi:hypothetical protein